MPGPRLRLQGAIRVVQYALYLAMLGLDISSIRLTVLDLSTMSDDPLASLTEVLDMFEERLAQCVPRLRDTPRSNRVRAQMANLQQLLAPHTRIQGKVGEDVSDGGGNSESEDDAGGNSEGEAEGEAEGDGEPEGDPEVRLPFAFRVSMLSFYQATDDSREKEVGDNQESSESARGLLFPTDTSHGCPEPCHRRSDRYSSDV